MATPFPFHITTSEGLLLPIPSGGVVGHPRSVKATFASVTMLDDECHPFCSGDSAGGFRVRCNEVNQALYVRAEAPTCYLWQATNFAEVIIWSSDEACCDINQQQCAETQVEVKFDSERDKVVVWAATRGDSAVDGVQDVCSPYSRFYWFYGELDYCDWAAAWPGPYVIPNQLTITHTTQGSGTTNCFVRPDTGETVIAIGYGGQVTLDEFSACEMPDQLPGQQCAVGPDWVCDPDNDNICVGQWTVEVPCGGGSNTVTDTSACVDPDMVDGPYDQWIPLSESSTSCTWQYTTIIATEGPCSSENPCPPATMPTPPSAADCGCCDSPHWYCFRTACGADECIEDACTDGPPPAYVAEFCGDAPPGPQEWTAVGCDSLCTNNDSTVYEIWVRGIKESTGGPGCCGESIPPATPASPC